MMKKSEYVEKLKVYRSDFPVFARECLRVTTKDGQLVPFELNRVQEYIWREVVRPKWESGEPVRIVCLKSRQLGITTLGCGLLAWLTFLRRNRRGLVTAHLEKSAGEIFDKVQLFYRYFPEEFRPEVKEMNRGRIYFERKNGGGLNSDVVVRVGRDVGRSGTFHGVHISELAFMRVPKKMLVSVRQSVPNLGQTIIFVESTANGVNFFHHLWQAEESDFERVFLSYVPDEGYRMDVPGDFRMTGYQHPLYGDEQNDELPHILAELGRWFPEESRDLEWVTEEARRILVWRRHVIESQCMGDLTLFRQEYPLTDMEAWQYSGASVFNMGKLNSIRLEMRRKEYECRKLELDRGTGQWLPSSKGELRLYEPIVKGARYLISADPSDGVKGGDPGAFHILRLPKSGQNYLFQAGAFHAVVNPTVLGIGLVELAKKYNDALLVVENNVSSGYTLLWSLYHHHRYRRLYYEGMASEGTLSMESDITSRLGFRTNVMTKTLWVESLREMVEDGSIFLKDEETLNQLSRFQKLESGKLACPYPFNDDLVDALGIGCFVARSLHVEVIKEQKQVEKYSLEYWQRKERNEWGFMI